jgi:ATP-dependent Clp protease protease subunit
MSDGQPVPPGFRELQRHDPVLHGPVLHHGPVRWQGPPDRPPNPWQVPPGSPGTPGGAAEGFPPWLQERLFDQRIVMLQGSLTGPVASQTAAALMTLDALGTDPIQLHVAAPDGDLAAAFALIDALDATRSPVHAVVTSQAGGAVVGVLAAANRRLAHRHARIRIAEPRSASMAGTADEVAAAAGQYLRELEELALRIVTATGQPRSRVEDDLSIGRMLTAPEALEYGLIDEIIGNSTTS